MCEPHCGAWSRERWPRERLGPVRSSALVLRPSRGGCGRVCSWKSSTWRLMKGAAQTSGQDRGRCRCGLHHLESQPPGPQFTWCLVPATSPHSQPPISIPASPKPYSNSLTNIRLSEENVGGLLDPDVGADPTELGSSRAYTPPHSSTYKMRALISKLPPLEGIHLGSGSSDGHPQEEGAWCSVRTA